MSRKKVIILLLLICIIAIAASVLFAINKRHTDWVVDAYIAALENAKAHFSDYHTTGSNSSYTKGVVKNEESFLARSDSYANTVIDGVDLSRLYTFMKNIHENKFTPYREDPIVETIEVSQPL